MSKMNKKLLIRKNQKLIIIWRPLDNMMIVLLQGFWVKRLILLKEINLFNISWEPDSSYIKLIHPEISLIILFILSKMDLIISIDIPIMQEKSNLVMILRFKYQLEILHKQEIKRMTKKVVRNSHKLLKLQLNKILILLNSKNLKNKV